MKSKWKYALLTSAFAGFMLFGHAQNVLADESTAVVQQESSDDGQTLLAEPSETETDAQDQDVTDTDAQDQDVTDTDAQDQDVTDTDTQDQDVTDTDTQDQSTADTDAQDQSTTGTETQEPDTSADDTPTEPVYTRTVEDGTYVISSALNGFKVLDIQNGSTENWGNVQLYEANGTDAQKFVVKWNDDGFYTIMNQKSGKYLDVDSGRMTSKTNLQQFEWNDTDSQKWFIVKDENNFFKIISKLSRKAIDIAYGNKANGTNVWLYSENDTDSQKFSFLKSGDNIVIKDGVYEISSALDTGKVLDIDGGGMSNYGNLQLYARNGSMAQKFIVTDTGSGTFRLTSLNSGMTIDLNNGSTASGTNISQYSNNNTKAQRWYIRNTGDGTCYLVPVSSSDIAVDVCSASTDNGTNIWAYTQNGSDAQKFIFTRQDYQPVTGEFILTCAGNENMVVDISDGNRKMQVNVQIYQNNGTFSQKFYINDEGNGFVSIQSVLSKHMLDVANGSRSLGANVWQYRDNNSMAQMWIARPNGDGTYTFINANSSKVLDVSGGRFTNRNNVSQYNWNGTTAQRFKLVPTTGTDNTAIDYSVYNPLDATDMLAQKISSSTGYEILVDLTHHRLSLYSGSYGNWKRIGRWDVGDGLITPTPTGSFYIYGKTLHFGEEHGYTCWYASYFYGSFYLHSVVCYKNTMTPNASNQTGRAVSHGCVRMDIDKARWIYNNCPIGTRVYVYR